MPVQATDKFQVVHSYYVGNWEEGCGAREHRIILTTENESEAIDRYQGYSEKLGDLSLTEDDCYLVWPKSHECRYEDEMPWGETYCRCGRRYSPPIESDELPF